MILVLIWWNKGIVYRKLEKLFLYDCFCCVYFLGFFIVIFCLNIKVSFWNSYDRFKKFIVCYWKIFGRLKVVNGR